MPLSEILFAPIVMGLSHSIETDHVVAVSNLVHWKNKWMGEAIRGATWGIGHTLSVAVATLLINHLKEFSNWYNIPFELFVGCMMVAVGLVKLYQLYRNKMVKESHAKSVFFQVGLLHGLAGSGTIAALLAGGLDTIYSQLLFLILFGVGTVVGMAVVAAVITKLQILKTQHLKHAATLVAVVSLLYGFKIIYEQTIT